MMHTLKDIAVFFDESEAGRRILDTAARLAGSQNSHLIAITTTRYTGALVADGFARGEAIAEVIQQRQALMHTHLIRAGQYLATVANRYGITAELRVIPYGDLDVETGLRSLYCDLLVVSHPDAPGVPFPWSSASVLQRTGNPILIVPRSWGTRPVARRITVGWNASRQARRAVADALPLLIAAESVNLLSIDPEHEAEEHEPEPGADMALYLARHGVRVDVQRIRSDGKPTAEVLVSHAAEVNSDLIVFGAYSRLRISEAILGGVSRTLLAEVPLPLFVSR
ncbi:universal stress protein [Achromobacter pulmonis]|uniref:UspA domain-containing protein n=2 Tax=Alcaligenaceae TaxID=506 RepID=A9IAE1_BORPD|nr:MULTISPECIES: universal stress protein [Alcaligenaceae]PND33693.1 universal stress protein [Achromobacter pulmonis]CAP44576.1 conserved hypothetical protein [Bordetella petrii]